MSLQEKKFETTQAHVSLPRLPYLCKDTKIETCTEINAITKMAKNSSETSFPQVDFALTNLTKIRQNCQIHGHSLGLTKFRLWDDLDFGKLDITPLGIYSFPCSVGFV